MMQLLIKYGNIVLTTTTGHRVWYLLFLIHLISFMPAIPSTSDRLHSEFIRLLFLQVHRETDRFLEFSQHNQTWGHRTSTFAVRSFLRS
jgi:hypothetical protein